MIVGSPTILNLVPGGVMKCVHVNQVNKNIEIQFKVMNGAAPYNVPEGVTCTIRGTKGDAFGYAAEAAVTAGSNVITVTLTEQLTAVAGAGNIFELVFVGAADDMKISTENFILAVERQAMGDDTVISDSDLSYAEQVLDQLQSVAAVNTQVQQNKANLAAEISRAQAAEAAETAARQAADNTLQSNINAEASTRATQDASLQSQINQLIAPSGSAPSAAEVENARVGADGTVYPTLGDAIRTQNSQLKNALNDCLEKPTNRTYIGTITEGYWKQSNGNDFGRSSALYLSASVVPNKTYYATGVSVNTSFALITLFDSNDQVLGTLRGDGNYTPVTDFAFITPNNCVKVAINGFWNIGTAWSMYPLLYSVDHVASVDGDTIEASLSEKQTKIAHWTKASYIYETGKYALIRRGKVEISTSAGARYSYAKLAYDKAKKYRFYGASRAEEILAVVCCDGNDNIIKSYETTLGTVIKGKVYDDIPEATVFIYVNGYGTSTAYIEVEEEAALKSFEGGKVGVCFGDSITQGANVYRWMSTPFEDYPSVVGRMLGCTIYNGGLGGSALSAGRTIDFTNVVDCIVSGDFSTVFEGITEYNLNESATKWYTEISNLNFSSVDFVTIAFGTNDWNFNKTTEQIKTALEYCLQKLITNFPKLRIYVFTPIYRFDINGSGQDSDTYVNATTGLKLHQVCEAIEEEAAAFNVPCKDMYYVCNINQYNKTYYMGDGTHPNANGYAVMGDKIGKFINAN